MQNEPETNMTENKPKISPKEALAQALDKHTAFEAQVAAADRLAKVADDVVNDPPMTDAELAEQRASWVRGEMGMGSDADEAAYRAAKGE